MIWKSPAPLLALLLASAAFAQGNGERIAQSDLPGFVVGYQEAQAGSSIEERVPQGETVERWTRMVTTQRFGGAVGRVTPAQLLETMSAGLAQSCPGGVAGPIRTFELSGRPAAEFRADCPRLASTGLPESFFGRVVAGAADLHMVQIAFRRVPSADDETFARRHLDSVVLCDAGSDEAACTAK